MYDNYSTLLNTKQSDSNLRRLVNEVEEYCYFSGKSNYSFNEANKQFFIKLCR